MTSTLNGIAASAEDGANIYNSPSYTEPEEQYLDHDPHDYIKYHMIDNMMNNFTKLPSWPIVERSYEQPVLLTFLTFKPFNSTYKRSFDAMDHVRKKIGSGHEAIIITREINATKVHYNAMVFSTKDLTCLHDKQTNYFKIFSKEVPMADKYKVHRYITKEATVRFFYTKHHCYANQDIYVYPRPKGDISEPRSERTPYSPMDNKVPVFTTDKKQPFIPRTNRDFHKLIQTTDKNTLFLHGPPRARVVVSMDKVAQDLNKYKLLFPLEGETPTK